MLRGRAGDQDISAPAGAGRFRGDSGGRFGRERNQCGRGDRGAALVEFAIVGTALFIMVFGVIDLGRAYFTWTSVKNAAREGAAFAERDPLAQTNATNCPDPNNIQYRAQTEQGTRKTNYNVTVTASRSGTALPAVPGGCELPSSSQTIQPGDQVSVKVTTTMTPISPIISFLTGGNVTIAATQSVVVQG